MKVKKENNADVFIMILLSVSCSLLFLFITFTDINDRLDRLELFDGFISSEITELRAIKITDEEHIEDLWQQTMMDRHYIRYEYDCTEFTKDFVDILNKNGYNATAVAGWYYSDSLPYGKGLHCWIEVEGQDFESTNGYFISDMSNYEFLKEGCW